MANSKNKILLVVEGEKEEIKILGSASHGLLSLIGAEYEIVPFKNPIYELYDAYKKDEFDDLVSYLRNEKGLKLEKGVLSKNAFSAIYLVFDFEPQDHKYSDEKIKEMLTIFNNETELGKLYINYPMVEAYYHLEKLPDPNFNERTIALENLNGKKYKKIVNTTTCIRKNRFTSKELSYIIYHNYQKSLIISKSRTNEANYMTILENQIKKKQEENEIYVLSTFALLPLDYNFAKTVEVIKKKIKILSEEELG